MGDSVISGKHYSFGPAEQHTSPPPSLPLVPLRRGSAGLIVRDLVLEGKVKIRDGLPTLRSGLAVARLEVDVEGLDWILEELDPDNLATTEIAYLRAIARHTLWERVSSSDLQLRGDEP